MPGYQRSLGQSVPFDDIAAAYSAGNNFHEYFISAGLGLRHIFNSDIIVVIPFGNLHLSYLKNELLRINLPIIGTLKFKSIYGYRLAPVVVRVVLFRDGTFFLRRTFRNHSFFTVV